MTKRLITGANGPVLVLGVHLCGTLSLRAAELFNSNPAVVALSLKPCCLPVAAHAYRKEVWSLGGRNIIAKEVCGEGRWKGGKWIGPPRASLEDKFKLWCTLLFLCPVPFFGFCGLQGDCMNRIAGCRVRVRVRVRVARHHDE
jgi:hypothetical protein